MRNFAHDREKIRVIKRTLRRLVPAPLYGWGRARLRDYRRHCQALRPQLGEGEFRRLLVEELGIEQGGLVFVHSSVDQFNLDFSPFRLLALLRHAVGEEGTLLFPATHLVERPETWLAQGEAFDLRRSPTSMGLLPELARRQRGAERSMHPTHSVVALGPLAAELVGQHHIDPDPCGVMSPYYKVVERGGLVVGLGVDADVLTMVHCVEDVLGERFPVATHRLGLFNARVVDGAGGECAVATRVHHPRIRFRHMVRYVDRHIGADICRRFRLGGAPCYRVDARRLYERMRALAEDGVTMYWRGIHRASLWERLLSHWAERLEAS
jgi:aminoglycoside 3-N-acetyltransferase